MATTKPKQKVAPRSKSFGGPEARERKLASAECRGANRQIAPEARCCPGVPGESDPG